ncbi:MAG: hypothetical protein ACP5N1_00650 [Candidatus Woesearchaeota archaeon]
MTLKRNVLISLCALGLSTSSCMSGYLPKSRKSLINEIKEYVITNKDSFISATEDSLDIKFQKVNVGFIKSEFETGMYLPDKDSILINPRKYYCFFDFENNTVKRSSISSTKNLASVVKGSVKMVFFHELGHDYVSQKISEMTQEKTICNDYIQAHQMYFDNRFDSCTNNILVNKEKRKNLEEVTCYVSCLNMSIIQESVAAYFQKKMTGTYVLDIPKADAESLKKWHNEVSTVMSVRKFNTWKENEANYELKYVLGPAFITEIFDKYGVDDGLKRIFSKNMMSTEEFYDPSKFVNRIINN